MNRARILITDDHALMAEGLRAMLEPEYEVVGVVANGLDLMGTVERLHPDLVLLDISLPGRSGMELAADLASHPDGIPFLMLTMHADSIYADEAVRLGARGFVLKMTGPEELRFAISEALAGRIYVTPAVSRAGTAARVKPKNLGAEDPLEALTERQREILKLIARGMTMAEIADELGVTTKSVEFHRGRIRKVLGLSSTAALVRFAAEQGLV